MTFLVARAERGRLRWFRRKPEHREPCEVCGELLKARDRVEVVDVSEDIYGGSGMIATYCRKHAPKEQAT